jgi:chlorobactene glucosyltransferase
MLGLFAFTFLPSWASNRTRLPLLAVGGGPGNLIVRADYEAIGGHEALRDAVVDDVALARLARRGGRRTAAARADDLVSVRMYHGGAEIVAGFTKNMFAVVGRSYPIAIVVTLLMPVFHLLPYALALTGDLVSIAAIVIISLTRVILFRSLRYRLDAALFLHPVMATIWTWIFIRSIWVTGIRRKLLWRGRTYDARRTRFGAERR